MPSGSGISACRGCVCVVCRHEISLGVCVVCRTTMVVVCVSNAPGRVTHYTQTELNNDTCTHEARIYGTVQQTETIWPVYSSRCVRFSCYRHTNTPHCESVPQPLFCHDFSSTDRPEDFFTVSASPKREASQRTWNSETFTCGNLQGIRL